MANTYRRIKNSAQNAAATTTTTYELGSIDILAPQKKSPAMRGFATYMPQGKLECATNVLERRNRDDDAQDDAANGNAVSLGFV
ncbi:hypothetical protein VNPA152080_63270 [Pseudomonas aeruginosa]|nr:hypothetical protein VNPA152080_63270 [Pseudomonas aeruginosa]